MFWTEIHNYLTTVHNLEKSSISGIPIISSILYQGYFVVYFTSLFDYLFSVVNTTTDNMIRERVFKADSNQNSETFTLKQMIEKDISILRLLVNLPPFSVMGVSLDVSDNKMMMIDSASIFCLFYTVRVITIS